MGMLEKSENFNSLRPILFELCKKTTPPPAGIGLNGILLKITFTYLWFELDFSVFLNAKIMILCVFKYSLLKTG